MNNNTKKPDTRTVVEKAADAVTGDRIDDKTGRVVKESNVADTRGPVEKAADALTGDKRDDRTGKRTDGRDDPGIQTGGRNADGSADTRGITEKVADAVTGDKVDDKTGKRTDR